MATSRSVSHLFTVRLWTASRADGETAWHGQVTHVLSGETRYFQEWSVLVDFLSTMQMGAPLMRPKTDRHAAENLGDDEGDA